MRKILISLLCLSTSVIGSENNAKVSLTVKNKPFNGFYAGVFAGYTNRAVNTSTNETGTIVPGVLGTINYSKTKKIPGFLYGLMAGYGQNLNGYYLGGEVTFHHDTTNKYKDHAAIMKVKGAVKSANFPFSFKTKYERSPVVGLGIRFGSIFSNDYLLFAKLGIEVSRDRVKSKAISFSNISLYQEEETGKKKTKVKFVPGIGIEKFLWSNVIGRIEYNYTFGTNGKISDDELKLKMKFTAHTIKAGLSYQF
jgi:opacity protein-like surface antigen